MVEVFSKALQETIAVDRIIGKVKSEKKGPTMVFFAGIHGNETAGVFALNKVFNKINKNEVKGTIYGISGNLKALQQNKRFIKEDLNRLWTKTDLKNLKTLTKFNEEQQEQIQLLQLLKTIINTETGPFYFIDLHTTSSKTLPFITINDAIINRKFSELFPVPIVLGIEEYLSGPLLSYINQLGYVSLGFESGQHDEKDAVLSAESFIYLALFFSKNLTEDFSHNISIHYKLLQDFAKQNDSIFEVIYRYGISKNEIFKMKEGFSSFQDIPKGDSLAMSNEEIIKSKYNATLFMPLYQKTGNDGYYLIQKIKPFFLKLSIVLRRLKADNLLVILPGISWEDKSKEVLKVNLRVAKFFAKQIFHLLGYRSSQIDTTHIKLYNRERAAKTKMYKSEYWYNNS